MPATATAPARAPRTRRQASSARAPRLVPVAVGRTAVAVGGLADSGLMVRLTRGRLWIGLLATLLVGIVGLNVVALSFSARSSETARKAEALEQRNSALQAQLASQLSNDELQVAASELGLLSPAPGAIRYLKPGEGDAATAAKRLRDGELTTMDSAPVIATPVAETTDPGVTEPLATDPAATDPAVLDPAATDPAAVDPATTESAEPVDSGAVTAGAQGGAVAP